MRSTKNHAQNLVKAAPIEGAAAPDLATLGLLEDDGAEETAVRPRPTDIIDEEPSTEFIDLEFSALDRAPEPPRPRELPQRELKDVEDGGGDSMLARYFRDMALHPVMGPEEELDTARTVEKSELDHWTVASLLPAGGRAHPELALEEQVAKAGEDEVQAPQIAELTKLVRGGEEAAERQADERAGEAVGSRSPRSSPSRSACPTPTGSGWPAPTRSRAISSASRTSRTT